jgi:hypothetical protein
MNAVSATWKNGQIVLDQNHVDWPEGCRLLVEPVPEDSLGIRDADWPQTPEEIERHLALMDQIEPLIMTEAEIANWEQTRKDQREFDKANFEKRAKKIEDRFR